MLRKIIVTVLIFLSFRVLSQDVTLITKFDSTLTPPAPDYSLNSSWASLPFIKDYADTIPGIVKYEDQQNNARADVFFIHPTSFTYLPTGPNKWNGDVNDKKLNIRTNEAGIRYQASIFNQVGKIYAPYYRQAHYFSYLTKDTASARQALEVAYTDVKKAFEYYLKMYNNSRPIIIAGHSQGTTHAIRLIREFFEGKPLGKQLVCAYIPGMPVYDTVFKNLTLCKNENETGCYCTWQTYAFGYGPKKNTDISPLTVCTNPLTWNIDDKYASSKLNKGGILLNMKEIIPELCDAQIQNGVLEIHKPKFKGSIFLRSTNYHRGDLNLFYMNIKENALLRIDNYLKQ